ncbi:hypothetical protein F5141DRAFT_100192 [Pisolithus sp. B1]|nr:hypothetical protein F5141DRAFT_100192 [Pisolithus sp. B1]
MVALVISLTLLSSLAAFHFLSPPCSRRPSVLRMAVSRHLSAPVRPISVTQSLRSAAESMWMSFVRSNFGESRLGNIIITAFIPLLEQQKPPLVIFWCQLFSVVRHFTFFNGRGCVAVQILRSDDCLPRSE